MAARDESAITRRRFVRDAGIATAAAGELLVGPAFAANDRARGRRRRPSVAVFGGGVAGLTAAHELAERGFDVTVYERRAWGGKARSMGMRGTGFGGRRNLPCEHGFRIVFGFYSNLPDTLRRIPTGPGRSAFDSMVPATQELFAKEGKSDLLLPLGPPKNPGAFSPELIGQLPAALAQLDFPPAAAAQLADRLIVYLSSCDSRRSGQWENTAWTDFIGAHSGSGGYYALLGDLPRLVQASHGERTSAQWAAGVLEALVYNLLGRGSTGPFDRPMNAPTNEAWINPWLDLLRRLGVRLRLGQAVRAFEVRRGRIVGARVDGALGTRVARADWYVCALPLERARRLWSNAILRADPRLAALNELKSGWMTGIQFFVRRPTPIVNGHVFYLGAPWAMTSISQAQFWDRDFAATYGDGRAQDCISVIVSDWFKPGPIFGEPAQRLAPQQVAREVWEQMKRHLNDSGSANLSDDDVVAWQIDPGMTHTANGFRNADPLTVPTVGSWSIRPAATTAIPNLMLAGDFGNGDWFVGTMEAANKSGRIAANAILDHTGSRAPRAKVLEHYRPPEWEPLKRIDEDRWRHGQPNMFDTQISHRRKGANSYTCAIDGCRVAEKASVRRQTTAFERTQKPSRRDSASPLVIGSRSAPRRHCAMCLRVSASALACRAKQARDRPAPLGSALHRSSSTRGRSPELRTRPRRM